MKVEILEIESGKKKVGQIGRIKPSQLPLKKNGWNFNWRKLSGVEGSQIFGLHLDETPDIIEGMLMLTLFNEEMLFMNNIETAPHNIGKNKKLDYVAGCLIAFACKQSFEIGRGHYEGFLSFDSKTELIALYENKYGATWATGHKMFFDPNTGKKLMKQYLKIK